MGKVYCIEERMRLLFVIKIFAFQYTYLIILFIHDNDQLSHLMIYTFKHNKKVVSTIKFYFDSYAFLLKTFR